MFLKPIVRRFSVFLVAFFLLSSCLSPKKYNYFQDKNAAGNQDSLVVVQNFEHLIASGDILSIYVSSISPEASSFFNSHIDQQDASTRESLPTIKGYNVNVAGEIELPFIGVIKVGGLTFLQAKELIRSKLELYLLNPTVSIYYENFRVTMLGEVTHPGVIKVSNSSITLTEAFATVGEITLYGVRTEVMIIREGVNGKKETGIVDMTDNKVFMSKYYYLHPNDIVYVAARKSKVVSGDLFFRVTPIIISILTFVTVVYFRFN